MGARPYRAAPHWYGPAALVAVLLLVAFRTWSTLQTPTPTQGQPLLSEGEYTVARAVDGDTLELASGERIRLLGVNTPETVAPNKPVEPWGPEATEFSQAFIAAGPVRLTFDQERHDRFGRHLAYAWPGETAAPWYLVGIRADVAGGDGNPVAVARLRATHRRARKRAAQLGRVCPWPRQKSVTGKSPNPQTF